MLNKLSVGALLKSVIGILGAVVIVMLAQNAWEAFARYRTANRGAAVVDISRNLFTALHNLRVDRSTTFRDVNGDRTLTGLAKQTQDVRTAEMAALTPALAALEALDFPQKQAMLPGILQSAKKFAAMHAETAAAVTQPKAQRRAGLAQEFNEEALRLLESLDKLSVQLTALVKLDDAMIDQLLILKQLAWIARNTAGDAQVMVSNALVGQKLPADAMNRYIANLGKADSVWRRWRKCRPG